MGWVHNGLCLGCRSVMMVGLGCWLLGCDDGGFRVIVCG